MSEVPSAVSESTAIEVNRKEGSAKSAKAVMAITAGDLVGFQLNASGLVELVGGTSGANSVFYGVALYTAVSGGRTVTIRGRLRATWDGATNAVPGAPIAASTTRSGWFETSQATSGNLVLGRYLGTDINSYITTAAANSGTLVLVEID